MVCKVKVMVWSPSLGSRSNGYTSDVEGPSSRLLLCPGHPPPGRLPWVPDVLWGGWLGLHAALVSVIFVVCSIDGPD